jgi:hypothetical protein
VSIEQRCREACRKLTGERESNKLDDQPNVLKKRDSVKATQKMTGDQLSESGSKHEAALPVALLEKAKARKLHEWGGGLHKNRELWQTKEEISEERKERPREMNLTLEELQEMSDEFLTVRNDRKWSTWTNLLVTTFGLPCRLDGLADPLKLALPCSWKDNLEGGKTKTFLKPLTMTHQDPVKDAAGNEGNKTCWTLPLTLQIWINVTDSLFL